MNIFVDMDGVLVDWVTGMLKLVNNNLKKDLSTITSDKMRKYIERIRTGLGKDFVTNEETRLKEPPVRGFVYASISRDDFFWIDLKELDNNIIKLWKPLADLADTYNCTLKILSSPIESDTKCVPQKIQWCQQHLGISEDRIIVIGDKALYATDEDGANILIDDTPKKLNHWSENGGISLHFKDNSQEIIHQVEELLKNNATTERMKDLSGL